MDNARDAFRRHTIRRGFRTSDVEVGETVLSYGPKKARTERITDTRDETYRLHLEILIT